MKLLRLAWRSIWRNRRRSIITVSSISFSLALAVFFIAFGDGMYAKLVDDAVRMQAGHMTVENQEYREAPAIDLTVDGIAGLRERIERVAGVERTKALVMGQGVVKSGGGVSAVILMGVQPSVEAGSSPLARKIIVGSYLVDTDERKVIIGSELAKKLKLGKEKEAKRLTRIWQPLCDMAGLTQEEVITEVQMRLAVGKKMVVSSNNIEGELVEELVRVKGIYHTGAPELDGYFIQVPIDFSRKVYGMRSDQATQLGVIVTDVDQRSDILSEVAALVDGGGTAVRPWEEVLPDLAAYIQVDKGSNIIFQGIFIFLILFIIFNTVLMSVLERRREFAVLLAVGTPPGRLKMQILYESAILGFLGVFFGLAIGGACAYAAQVYGIDLTQLTDEGMSVSGFAVDMVLHALVTLELLVVMGTIVFGATLVISLYPMAQINRIHVADVLR